MKKVVIGLVAVVVILIILLMFISGSGGYKAGDVLTEGSYIYGEDIKESSYMYNFTGPGEVLITSGEEEVYYRELLEGETIHEHYIPLTSGDVIEVKGEADFGLI